MPLQWDGRPVKSRRMDQAASRQLHQDARDRPVLRLYRGGPFCWDMPHGYANAPSHKTQLRASNGCQQVGRVTHHRIGGARLRLLQRAW